MVVNRPLIRRLWGHLGPVRAQEAATNGRFASVSGAPGNCSFIPLLGAVADGVGPSHYRRPARRMALRRLRDADAEARREVQPRRQAATRVRRRHSLGRSARHRRRLRCRNHRRARERVRRAALVGPICPHTARRLIEAASDCELALCSAPASGKFKARVINPNGDVGTPHSARNRLERAPLSATCCLRTPRPRACWLVDEFQYAWRQTSVKLSAAQARPRRLSLTNPISRRLIITA